METTFEMTEYSPITEKKIAKSQSIRIKIDKMKGGYISDHFGEREIYRDGNDIIEGIGFYDILTDLQNEKYYLNIDLLTKADHNDYVDYLDIKTKEKQEETLTYEQAKELGIIQVEKFNPIKKVEEEPEKEIKITASNCYSAGRLQKIDWNSFDEQCPLTMTEKADISGSHKPSMYSLWSSIKAGKATFQRTETKIAMTILAKYYEKNLGIRTSTKEQTELLKTSLLADIRELELLTESGKFVKARDIGKIINAMRKSLL